MQLFSHLTVDDLEGIAQDIGIKIYNVRDGGTRSRGKFASRNAVAFILKPQDDTYRLVREGFGGRPRRCWAVDWHGHYAFMERVFDRDPGATIKSAIATYAGREQFYAIAPLTGARNIGSMMQPLAYEDATTDLLS